MDQNEYLAEIRMNLRIRISRFLLRLAGFIESMPVVIMKPDDLIEYGRQTYSKPQIIKSFSEDNFVDDGLNEQEINLLGSIPTRSGNLLLLGVGGGREAISLARMGFEITGIDFIPEMVDQAIKNAASRELNIRGLVQDITKITVPDSYYDVVWLSLRMYSSIPTNTKRIAMIKRIKQALKPGGLFLCQFYWDPNVSISKTSEWIHRIISVIFFGNHHYQAGDILWRNSEFIHIFTSQAEIIQELEAGGFVVERIYTDQSIINGSAVCRRPNE